MPLVRLELANNAVTTTTAELSAIADTIAVTDASDFPQTNKFRCYIGAEIVEVGEVVGNEFRTMTRGVEGTTAAVHASGAAVELRFTAGVHEEIWDALDLHDTEITALEVAAYTDGSNANGYYRKWADNRLECWISTLTLVYLNSANLRETWTFPHAFVDALYTIQMTAVSSGPVAGRTAQNLISTRNTTTAVVDRSAPTGTYIAGDTQNFTLYATGFWQ